MYRIKNTSDDRTKVHLHRTSPGFNESPILGNRRIGRGEKYDITDEYYESVKKVLDGWIAKGMVSVTKLEGDGSESLIGKEKPGPTLEEWVKHGYDPANYASTPVGEMHPWGFRVKPSPGLTKYLKEQAEAQKAAEKSEPPPLPPVPTPEIKKLEMSDSVAPTSDTLTMSTEPAGAPPSGTTPPPMGGEERSDAKKGSGKKKLV